MREAFEQNQVLHGKLDGEASSTCEVHHRREERPQIREIAFRMPRSNGRTLPVQVHFLHDENEKSAHMDPPHVSSSAGSNLRLESKKAKNTRARLVHEQLEAHAADERVTRVMLDVFGP